MIRPSPFMTWVSLAIQAGLVVATLMTQHSGPFPTVTSMLLQWLTAGLVASVAILLATAVPWWLLCCILTICLRRPSSRMKNLATSIMFSMTVMLIPLTMFCSLSMMEFGAKPWSLSSRCPWLPNTGFAQIEGATPALGYPLLLTCLAICVSRWTSVRQKQRDDTSCRHCGHSGQGLSLDAKCPECGSDSGRPLWS